MKGAARSPRPMTRTATIGLRPAAWAFERASTFARAASSRCSVVATAPYLLVRGRRLTRRQISPRPIRAAGKEGESRRPVRAMAAPLGVDESAAVFATGAVAPPVADPPLDDVADPLAADPLPADPPAAGAVVVDPPLFDGALTAAGRAPS